MKYLYNYYLHVQDILISILFHNKYFWSIDTQVETRYMCQYCKIRITSKNSCINISTDYNMVPHSHTDWQISIHIKNLPTDLLPGADDDRAHVGVPHSVVVHAGGGVEHGGEPHVCHQLHRLLIGVLVFSWNQNQQFSNSCSIYNHLWYCLNTFHYY